MEWKRIEDNQSWEAFIKRNGPRSGAFLHSWNWGGFQEVVGKKVKRMGMYQGEELVAVSELVEVSLPKGFTYLYCPRGPVVAEGVDHHVVLASLHLLAGNALFFRLCLPFGEVEVERGMRKVKNVQPAETRITDLSLSEEKLMAAMHQKTRYNIRLASKKGVEVVLYDEVSFDEVWPLFETTGARGEFGLHKKAYYVQMLEELDEVFLATARFEGKIIAACLMMDYAGTRTYLHGASSNEHRNVMAPHLLHWELVKEAKEKGVDWYDWWGVAPEGAGKDHAWAGVSRFKRGFPGEEVSYAGTYDVVRRPLWYWGYQVARKILKRR